MSKRMSVYKSDFKSKSRQTLVYNSIKKYGFQAHGLDVIDTFRSNYDFASGREMFWIRSYMSNKNRYPEQNGLNLTDGGDGIRGYKATPEAIEKNRRAKLGKRASEETRRKISESNKGKKMNFTHLTPEFRKMMGDRNRLYKHTDEAKKKIGEASRGNKHRLGYKMTPEQIEHRSSMIRGTKRSENAKKNSRDNFIKNNSRPILVYLNGIFLKEFIAPCFVYQELPISKASVDRMKRDDKKIVNGYSLKYK